MDLRVAAARWLGVKEGSVVISKPNAHSSVLNPLDTYQSKTLRNLQKGSSQEQLEILNEINSNAQLARQVFESNELGVDNSKAIKVFRELTRTGSQEVKEAAIEALFTYAGFKSGNLIKAGTNGYGHKDADDILDHAKDFLLAKNDNEALVAASDMASKLGYHATHRKQAVIVELGGEAAKGNNFMYQLHAQKGAGRLIHDLLTEAGIYETNQNLVATHFEKSDSESDPSVQNPLARENIAHNCDRSIMGWMGSWSSCNFKFEYTIPTQNGVAAKNVSYDLDKFIESTAKEGPEKACEKFIEHYTALVEYKESIRANNPTSPLLKEIEKQQTKALKFIFDPNKLKANSREGALIHDAITREMKEKGASSFLKHLFKAVTQPNEMAEIKKVSIDFKKAFGTDLTYTDDANVKQNVITMADYRKAQSQMSTGYNSLITQCAGFSGLTVSSKEDHSSRRSIIEGLAETYKDDPNGFAIELGLQLPSIKLDIAAQQRGFKQTTEDLKNQALKQINDAFTHFGEDFETHIKRGGAQGAISAIKDKSVDNLSPEERTILSILNTDQKHEQEIRDGREFAPSIIESLLRKEENGVPSVNATIVAAQILLEKIEERAALPLGHPNHLSSTQQDAAIKLVKEQILGVDLTTNIRSSANIPGAISRTNYEHTLLASLDDHIQYHAKDRFGNEIRNFLSYTVPEAEIDTLNASLEQLHELSDNLHALEGVTDHAERKRLEVANLKILGITNTDNPLAPDYTSIFGTLADPNIDSSLVDIFLETIKQVMDMIKAGFDLKTK